ncbi:hypothetical protein ZEAMMB73_Zm00001d020129 [Zea mays]|uniref:SANTA domain-containing protein n=1 Tax=Zea mays TaxID=4577 RepID=A0A1D6I287_MAIZE|nr:hypothetical protein ZEAMMB73_Zm00001d020129 [Zea mays]
MPSQPQPSSIGGTSQTPAPFQTAPVFTGGSPRTLATLSAQSVPRVTRRSIALVDWCLERVEGEEGKIRVAGTTYTPQTSPQTRHLLRAYYANRREASSSKGSRKVAGRVFRSSAIVRRHDHFRIMSEDGYLIRIGCLLNIPKTRNNGFSEEVCECFEFGFPIQWHRLVNPKMVPDNKHALSPSETTASAPSHSVGYYMEKFLSDSFSNSNRYSFTENDSYTSVVCTGSRNGLTTQTLSNLPDDNAGNITVSWGLYGLGMDMSEKPWTPPAEACNNRQESDQHESMQIDACKQELVNRSMSSVSVKQSISSISPNSKVDGNRIVPSKIMSVVNESYRSTVGCGQAEEDVGIQQEKKHSCSSEHGMVTLSINCTSSQLGAPGIPKFGKDSVNLWTTDALELSTEGMTPKIGADSTDRRLRSGKILGMPSGGLMNRGHKLKKIKQEASSKQMVNQGATCTVDLTSHENVGLILHLE